MDYNPRIEFPQEFFQPEVREDFLVDATMKTVWAAEMELLADIDAVCRKYGIQYFAYWGTLLGAIRHKGYIPWDDDMDIAMKREDYNKLMSILPKEIPETYRVYYALSEKGHDQFWGCVTNADTISSKPERLRKFHGCPFWVGIDFIPLDYIPRNKSEAQSLKNLLTVAWNAEKLLKIENLSDENKRDLDDCIEVLQRELGYTFHEDMPLINQLCRLENLLASSYGKNDGDLLTVHTTALKCDYNFDYPKEWWRKAIEVPFENITMRVPVEYEKVLRHLYGDYNIRVRGGSDHEYPFYQAQIRQLREMLQKMEENQN